MGIRNLLMIISRNRYKILLELGKLWLVLVR